MLESYPCGPTRHTHKRNKMSVGWHVRRFIGSIEWGLIATVIGCLALALIFWAGLIQWAKWIF